MHPTQEPITGSELGIDTTSAYGALVQFYNAFNYANIVLMSENWANTPDIAMDNPLGGIKRGWKDIKSVYQRIFDGKAEVHVEFYDYTIHEGIDFFYAVGRERGQFKASGQIIHLAIRTSRIYQKLDGKWKQVHHHGSIENPELLKSYQQLVNN